MGSHIYGSYFYKLDYLDQVRRRANVEVVEALDGYISEVVARSVNLTMADREMVYGSSTSFSTGVLPNFNSGLPGVVHVAAGSGYTHQRNQLSSQNSGRAIEKQSTTNNNSSCNNRSLSTTPRSPHFPNNNDNNTPQVSNSAAALKKRKKESGAKKKVFDDANGTEDKLATEVTTMSKEAAADLKFSFGYDSDGELPFTGTSMEEKTMMEEYNEESLSTSAPSSELSSSPTNDDAFIFISQPEMKKMKVDQLRKELKKRGLSTSGNKAALIERIQKAMVDKVAVVQEQQQVMVDDEANFKRGSYWKTLTPTIIMEDPAGAESSFFSPTETHPDLRAEQPKKKSFENAFDRPVFAAKTKVPSFHANKRRKVDKHTKQPAYKEKTVDKGTYNSEWVLKHNLTPESCPVKFFGAMVPFELTAKWNSYTNTRATQENAGKIGGKNGLYPDFVPFEIRELRQHIGVQILHGILPSPRLEMKFKSQKEDEINGNDFVARNLGPNATRRHKHFRHFFCIHNPTTIKPDRTKRPNYKLEEFFQHIQTISQEAWICGIDISVDEQTLKFQGRHIHKLRISYKREGDGFQCDTLCSDGYTFDFFFRNDEAPKKYTKQGLSPLHSRVMALFDSLGHKFHRCGMDNLYTSARFCKAAYKHTNKVLVHGVARKSGRGLPSTVLQEEVQNRTMQNQVRGTVKAAQLMGDPDMPDLVAVSVYDTKPVHFFSARCDKVQWIEKTRKVFDKAVSKTKKMKFLRLNIVDEYNHGMGHVDIADQLRNVYRMDHWLRNYKWWHAMFWWGFQVLQVNCYLIYKRVCEDHNVTPMEHYLFRRDIAMGWIDPDAYGEDVDHAGYTTPSDAETISTLSISSTGRKARVSDASLNPQDGSLRCRLNRTCGHWPSETESNKDRNKPACQLHKWAAGLQKRNNVAFCADCNVILCLQCWESFHTVYDIVSEKTNLRKAMSDG